MGKLKIITDTASDIPKEIGKKYDLDLIPFPIVIGDKSYLSGGDLDNEECFRLMEENEGIPMTSQITSYQFMEKYYHYYKEGYTDLLLVLINGKGSATYGNALMAVDMLFEEHPECEGKIKIHCHDGMSYSGSYGHPVIVAAQMAQEGKTVEEINQYLDGILPKRKVYFGIYHLKYAAKSGRIPSAAAFIGDKMGIHPIMVIKDGEITTASKCRGDKKVVTKVKDLALAEMEKGSDYQLVYGADVKVRDEMIEKLTQELGYGPTECYQIGPVIAANSGPKVIGIFFNVKEEA